MPERDLIDFLWFTIAFQKYGKERSRASVTWKLVNELCHLHEELKTVPLNTIFNRLQKNIGILRNKTNRAGHEALKNYIVPNVLYVGLGIVYKAGSLYEKWRTKELSMTKALLIATFLQLYICDRLMMVFTDQHNKFMVEAYFRSRIRNRAGI
ncbi:hypothetical protein Trydic_g17202 [Trypoxylus dichotomus]